MPKCLLITTLSIVFLFGCSSNPYQEQQESLAKQLGLKIEDYSFPESFPEGYFYDVLKPGMSPNEVHKIFTGYEKVFLCGTYREIYYYFASADDKALRFQVFYDKDKKYKELQGEDDDSRYILIDDCILGGTVEENR